MKYVKTFFRLLLGLFMTYAGISHLTIARQEFVAQVPTWLQFSPGFTDFVVLALWPFGSKIQRKEPQPGCLNMFMNVIWFFVGGIWIWLTHIFYGLIFCITIIGIPFGKMHFRLARLALSPFGKEVV